MLSPMAVSSLALLSVAGGERRLGGSFSVVVHEVATVAAGLFWGFALWSIAAAPLTCHAGRVAITRTAADWGFVFPAAAMVLATGGLGYLAPAAADREGVAAVLDLEDLGGAVVVLEQRFAGRGYGIGVVKLSCRVLNDGVGGREAELVVG